MFVGNDIVDLRGEAEQHHPRFPRRVLTDCEYHEYLRAPDPHTFLWSAWAAKEGAYKYMRQVGLREAFQPKAFEYSRHVVRHGTTDVAVTVDVQAQYVTAVAVKGARHCESITSTIDQALGGNRSPAASAGCGTTDLGSHAVRAMAQRRLAVVFSVAIENVTFKRTPWGMPEAYVLEGKAPVALSFSHHGRFASIVVASCQEWEGAVWRA